MLIKVTEDDILKGDRARGGSCPVARAIIKITENIVAVNATCIRFYNKAGTVLHSAAPTDIVAKFIMDFDCNRTVYPFEFELDIPE